MNKKSSVPIAITIFIVAAVVLYFLVIMQIGLKTSAVTGGIYSNILESTYSKASEIKFSLENGAEKEKIAQFYPEAKIEEKGASIRQSMDLKNGKIRVIYRFNFKQSP